MGNIVVPHAGGLDEAFTDDNHINLARLYEYGTFSIEVILTRRIMYLPPKYVALTILNPVLTPCDT